MTHGPAVTFIEELRATIDAGRVFGRHPLWRRIVAGDVSRAALAPFVVQFFLQVREFPRAVSARAFWSWPPVAPRRSRRAMGSAG